MLQISEIFNAAAVLKGVARKTSLIPAPKVNPDAEVFLKTENLQLTGSFKLRGAYYKISQLSDQEKAKALSHALPEIMRRVLLSARSATALMP